MPMIKVTQNAHDNLNGFIGQRKVAEFGTSEQRAKEWLVVELKSHKNLTLDPDSLYQMADLRSTWIENYSRIWLEIDKPFDDGHADMMYKNLNKVYKRLMPDSSKEFFEGHRGQLAFGDNGGYVDLPDRGQWFDLPFVAAQGPEYRWLIVYDGDVTGTNSQQVVEYWRWCGDAVTIIDTRTGQYMSSGQYRWPDEEKQGLWTDEHRQAARAEGWELFDVARYVFEVQREDETEQLPDDEAAHKLVMNSDAPHHVAARQLVQATNPKAYEEMAKQAEKKVVSRITNIDHKE